MTEIGQMRDRLVADMVEAGMISCPECLDEGYVEVGSLDDIHRVKCECQISKEADEQYDNSKDN